LVQISPVRSPAQRWKTFLENHREVIAAMDFFTVPTLTFGAVLLLRIAHDGRRILHIKVTRHQPASGSRSSYVRHFPMTPNTSICCMIVMRSLATKRRGSCRLDAEVSRTSFRSPWQNGIAGRWVGSCRRELLDHVIPLNERHLKRLVSEYVRYYHEDRTHLGLKKDTPCCRPPLSCIKESRILALPRVGGLHHRYDVAA
jgi:putative transposase